MPSSLITVALYDEQELIRHGISEIIEKFGLFEVTVQAENIDHLFRSLEASVKLPDICIMEIQTRSQCGWNVLAMIKKKWPSIKLLVLTNLVNDEVIYNLIKSDADGYLPKNSRPEELKDALNAIFINGSYLPYTVLQRSHKLSIKGSTITDKEKEFLAYCIEDITLKEIANKMNVSPRTVDNYRDSLFRKLNLKTRAGLVMFAIKSGLMAPFE